MSRPRDGATRATGASFAFLTAAWVLTGCAGLSTGTSLPADAGRLSGRLAVRVDAHDGAAARSENAGFELRGDATDGELDLSTPLGSTLARARWSPGSVVLATPQGRRRYADLDTLTREVLGESVPVVALFDWLHGRPWTGAPSTASTTTPGFAQLGWAVDTGRLGEGWLVATRAAAPVVTVRARLDPP